MADKFWFPEEIKKLLETNDEMVMRSIVKLYECQTSDEQTTKETKHSNGVGFSAFDAEILSSFAEQIKKYHHLSNKQMVIARKKIMRYTKQLTAIANSGLPRVKPETHILKELTRQPVVITEQRLTQYIGQEV